MSTLSNGPGDDPATSTVASGDGAGVVELRQVQIVRSGRRILGPVDWQVEAGQRWVVLGPNGAGKTTLLRLLGAVERPTSGTARLFGATVGAVDLRLLRRRIGVAGPSLGHRLAPGLTALEVVLTGGDSSLAPWWGRHDDRQREAAAELLRRGGLGSRMEQVWESLSDGERQQALLARVLLQSPDLLLLDEPAASLDLANRESMVARLRQLGTEQPHLPVVLVTHHPEEIPPGFTHGLCLKEGRIDAAGTLAQVMVPDVLSSCFDVGLDVDCSGGRWWARAARLP
ncbi:MAG: ATP-binding cassette domain-containing protein [Actinomycetota bacterium]|nr:ATP-binding cassette domain-containing protein [Actinomycetota bacterium]